MPSTEDAPGAVDVHHGVAVSDPYRWLEEPEDPRTRRWVAEQLRLVDTEFRALTKEIAALRADIRSLPNVDARALVKTAGARRFRLTVPSDGVGWQVDVRNDSAASWRPILRDALLGERAAIRRWEPSPSGRYLVVQVALGGADDVTPLTVVDVGSGAVVDAIDRTRYSPVSWHSAEDGFYYARRHSSGSGGGVYWHRLGTPVASDMLLWGDEDPLTRYQLALWHDRWLALSTRHGTDSDAKTVVVDLDERSPLEHPVVVEGTSAAGLVVDRRGRLLVLSTADAEFGRIMAGTRCPEGRYDWRVLVPERAPAMLRTMTLTQAPAPERLVVGSTVDGRARVAIHDPADGSRITEVGLPDCGTVVSLEPTDDPVKLSVAYTDWVTPVSTYRLDLRTGSVARELRQQVPVEVTASTYRSFDGTEVPITVLFSRGSTGPMPTLLFCYGGFGATVRPRYQPDVLAWALAGGLVAVAHVRGGGERGRRWHELGRGRDKGNSVLDLHAAADWLVESGMSRRDGVALLGGSNAGLLVACAMAQRPAAYAAVAVGSAPLDMMRYELLGLGGAWRGEYGSVADASAFESLLRLSPYHNVSSGVRYPPALFYTGDNDTRVDPAHSRKMVAALQEATVGGPVLLSVISGMGHDSGGGDGAAALSTKVLAFLAHHAGLDLLARQRAGA